MRRVVVTGMGIWSCIGQDLQTVTESLRLGRSGIVFDQSRIDYGLQSGLVGNVPRPDLKPLLPRKFRATMSEDAEYAYMAARQAFQQAGIDDEYIKKVNIGIIMGNDGNSHLSEYTKIIQDEHNSLMLGPNGIFRCQSSSAVMNLSTIFGLRGISFSVGASCSSSMYAIALSALLIRNGLQEIILTGGSSHFDKCTAAFADCFGNLSIRNDSPAQALCAFDKKSDGTVYSDGAATLILEEYEHAKARNAPIYAEIAGLGFSTNGTDNIHLTNSQAELKSISTALQDANLTPIEVDFINCNGSSILNGDRIEAITLSSLFKNGKTWISTTESLTGHENWALGSCKIIYTIIMMNNNFIIGNKNLKDIIPEAEGLRIATRNRHLIINNALCNTTGTGGFNSTIILKKI